MSGLFYQLIEGLPWGGPVYCCHISGKLYKKGPNSPVPHKATHRGLGLSSAWPLRPSKLPESDKQQSG